MKRKSTGLCGILAIDKPKDITSHDVVGRIRSITHERRVGHAGTLDPMATGLLLVCVGAATRLSPYLTAETKSYDARIVFGVATDTDDAQGRAFNTYSKNAENVKLSKEAAKVTEHIESIENIADKLLDEQFASETLHNLKGSIEQLPPAYCAIKKDGITAYKAARAGKSIKLDARRVNIFDAKLISLGKTTCALTDMDGKLNSYKAIYWDVSLTVSKGTYIRSIARDLGIQFGCGAHLGALRRTQIGSISLENPCTYTLDELEQKYESSKELPWLNPIEVLNLPVLKLDEKQQKLVSSGCALRADKVSKINPAPKPYAVYEPAKIAESATGALQENTNVAQKDADTAQFSNKNTMHIACINNTHLLAVYEQVNQILRAATVIPGGVAGVL